MLCPAADIIRLVVSTINCYTTNTATIISCNSINLYVILGSGGQ